MFNEDLLTLCKEPQFKKQHTDSPSPPDIFNEEEEKKYEIIGNKDGVYNSWSIGKVMGINMISG